jgi:hypothetical protein
MRLEYMNWVQRKKSFYVTLIENIERVTNMRLEYMNWVQRKKSFYVTLIENIERVTNMRIEYMNRIQENFSVTLIEKYRKGNEYAYRIYEQDPRKF